MSNKYSQVWLKHSLRHEMFDRSKSLDFLLLLHPDFNFEQTLVQVNDDCIHRTAVLPSMSLNK